jgi:hypothetical protein
MNQADSKFYTSYQHKEFVDEDDNYRIKSDNNKVFAKCSRTGLSRNMEKKGPQHYKYYIRCYANKTAFDPFPKYTVSDNKNSFIDKICRPETSYREVNQSVFNNYLNFLKTENAQWYNRVNKDMKDS